MSDEQLIIETNELLRRLLEVEAQRKANADLSRGALKERLAEIRTRAGVDKESDEALEARRLAAQAKSDERITQMREKEEEYRQRLLGELATQTDLLRRIGEKLSI